MHTTLCFIPPDKLLGYLLINSERPYVSSKEITFFLLSSVKVLVISNPNKQLSKIVLHENKESFCNM